MRAKKMTLRLVTIMLIEILERNTFNEILRQLRKKVPVYLISDFVCIFLRVQFLQCIVIVMDMLQDQRMELLSCGIMTLNLSQNWT